MPDWGGGTKIATGEKSVGYKDKNKDWRQKTQRHPSHNQTIKIKAINQSISNNYKQ